MLYDAYYDELEQYANYQQKYVSSGGTIPPPPGPGPFPGSVELDKNGAVIGHPHHPPNNHPPNSKGRGKGQQPMINGRGKHPQQQQAKHPPPQHHMDSEFDDEDPDDDGEYEDEEDEDEYEEDEEEEDEDEDDPDAEEDEELVPNGGNGKNGRRRVSQVPPQRSARRGQQQINGKGAGGRDGFFNLGSSLTVTGGCFVSPFSPFSPQSPLFNSMASFGRF